MCGYPSHLVWSPSPRAGPAHQVAASLREHRGARWRGPRGAQDDRIDRDRAPALWVSLHSGTWQSRVRGSACGAARASADGRANTDSTVYTVFRPRDATIPAAAAPVRFQRVRKRVLQYYVVSTYRKAVYGVYSILIDVARRSVEVAGLGRRGAVSDTMACTMVDACVASDTRPMSDTCDLTDGLRSGDRM